MTNIPEDGILLCSRCGKRIDLNQDDVEAFQCQQSPEKYFCSNNCLREYVLGELDDDDE